MVPNACPHSESTQVRFRFYLTIFERSQKSQKWSRTKAILQAWTDKLAMSKQLKVNSKEFKSDRGFLVYISRTYPAMVPYLKGFHLMLELQGMLMHLVSRALDRGGVRRALAMRSILACAARPARCISAGVTSWASTSSSWSRR